MTIRKLGSTGRRNNSPKRSDPYARRQAIREPYDEVLLVCEGVSTEPHYFESLIREEILSTANIHIEGRGASPRTLVDYARNHLKDYDRVYCVFDGDVESSASAIASIESSAEFKAEKWHGAITTPCFEFWLLLHFRYTDAPYTTKGGKTSGEIAVKELTKEWPEYSKGLRGVYEALKPRLAEGLRHGARLEKSNKASGSKNPMTTMHSLVNYLRALRSEGKKGRRAS